MHPSPIVVTVVAAGLLGLGLFWRATDVPSGSGVPHETRERRPPEMSMGSGLPPSPQVAVRDSEDAASQSAARGSRKESRESAPRIALRSPPVAPATDAGWRTALEPRAPLPKEPLVSPRGRLHRLTVKLLDRFEARAAAGGELLVTAERPDDVAALTRVADEWLLNFLPVQTATDEGLRKLEDRAARRTGRAQPDLGGIVEVVLPDATPERVLAAATALHRLPQVEFAEITSIDAPPPPPQIGGPTPSLISYQTYRQGDLGQGRTGIDVDYVWNTYGIRGVRSLRVTDCEYGYFIQHEDLEGYVSLQLGNPAFTLGGDYNHGTAVLGILGAGDNGYGMTGCAPRCRLFFYPEGGRFTNGTVQSREATITAAIVDSEPGDIVVLEMQAFGAFGNLVPAEFVLSVWLAVATGSDADVIIVAAAGNGNEDLDGAAYANYRARGDSKAIIVGGGDRLRQKTATSTYGARVNLQGWGESVATTGYGDIVTGVPGLYRQYTATFGGTSAATPIVASAAALLQSVAIVILERRLTHREMRTILIATGRSQVAGHYPGNIGPLPDLAAAVEYLIADSPPQFRRLNSWGYYHFATNFWSLYADPDGNGIPNLLEYLFGTDPKTESAADQARMPRLSVEPGPGQGRTIVFEFFHPESREGATWAVEFSRTLAPGSWKTLWDGLQGVTFTRNGDRVTVTITENPAEPQKFFRLRATEQ